MIALGDIRTFFRGRIALNEPLGHYTSFQIGGPADYFLEPADKDDCVAIVLYCQRQKLPYLLMGKGSNMLVSDDGVRGAVINLEAGLHGLRCDGAYVIAEAGISIAKLVDFCIQNGFRGVEMLPGIPGTLGGAVMMNAGAYGGETADHLVEVEVLRNGVVRTIPKEEVGFSYRHSGLRDDVILGARFRLPQGDKAELMRQRRELLIRRNRTQPINYPNSGSMFKNPAGTHAAKLIEDAGLKGCTIGKAQISERHANFMINLGGAKSGDVLALIERAQKTVFEKFDVHLELEVKLVGFEEAAVSQVWA